MAALLRHAREAADPARAESLAGLAAEAAPGDARPRAFLARLYFPERPLAAAAEGSRWLVRVLSDPWAQAVALRRLGAGAALASWAAALALLLLAGMTRGALVFHDYRDCFPRRFRGRTPAAFALLAGVALWTAGAGPALFALFAGLALAPYLPRPARWVLGVCLGLGCLLPASLDALSAVAGAPGERAWALYRVWKGDSGAALAADLERAFSAADARALFARSRVARRAGRLEDAAALLEQVLSLPAAPKSLVYQELGTLRFQQGRTDDALAAFARAVEEDPRDPLPWLNRHVVHLDRLELGLADHALERARELGAPGMDRMRKRSTEAARHLVPVSPALPGEWIRDELLRGGGESPHWVGTLSQGLFFASAKWNPAFFAALALGTLFPSARAGSGLRSHRCPSCGFLVCPRCGRRVRGTLLCPACWAAQREDEADSAEKERQTRHIAAWQARRARWLRLGDALMPGWSAFLASGSLVQLALGALWAGLAGWVALGFLYPVALLPWSPPGRPWGAAVGLLIIHGAALWAAARRPSRAEG
jgi:tetratricopeptide (TPR) repeat protein